VLFPGQGGPDFAYRLRLFFLGTGQKLKDLLITAVNRPGGQRADMAASRAREALGWLLANLGWANGRFFARPGSPIKICKGRLAIWQVIFGNQFSQDAESGNCCGQSRFSFPATQTSVFGWGS